MKLDRLETHDRLQHFTKQSFDIAECCQDMINKRPFGEHPFYIFAHARTDEDGVRKRLIWQPRLTKPKSQSNSMLFKAYPGTETIKVIWMIPSEELWGQYGKGLMTENKIVSESIHDFNHNRAKLEQKEDDDLTDAQIDSVYQNLSRGAKTNKKISNLII